MMPPELGQEAYGHEYWMHMDGGAGPVDSVMWEDLAHITKELFFYDPETNADISAGKSFMDVGCGQGYLVRHMRRRGLDAWGGDYSDFALDMAPEDIREYLQQFDLTTTSVMSLRGAPFNLISCFETMEHIPEDQVDAALTNILGGLKPGGSVLFAICTSDRDGADRDPTHVNVQPREYWEKKFSDFGLRRDLSMEAYMVSTFHLLRSHNGMFVVSR